jgi:predicted GNAT family N-acyltransferase
VAADNSVPPAALDALARLQQPPITQRFFRIVREFWIDRVLIAAVMTAGTVTLALVPIPLWIKLMVPLSSFPLLYLVYEYMVREEGVHAIGKGIPAVARAIGDLLPVRVVTFGHSHRPRLQPLRGGLTFVDTGTWAPVTRMDDRRRVPGYRNYLVASFDGDRAEVRLECWDPVRPKVRVARGKDDWAACQSIRRAVFIHEQGVTEQEEWDGMDGHCTHFLAFAGYRSPAGTARLRTTLDGMAHAERVAVVRAWRRQGVGRALMEALEAEARARGCHEVVLHAQAHAVPFYKGMGYVTEGEEFVECRIRHRAMRKAVSTKTD